MSKITDKQKQAVITEYLNGATYRRISEKTKVARSTVGRIIAAYKAGELEHELTPQEELKTLCKIAEALGLSYGELISRVDNKKPLVEPKPAEVVEIKAELPEVVIEAIGAEMARLEVRIADDLKAIESKEAEIKLLKEANERRFGAIKELGAFVNDND